MTSVFYTTFYGSTRQYAEALAARLGTVARELPATLEATGGPVVVLSPVHGPSHPGVRFIKSLPAIDRPLALVTVGMTLVDVARHDDAPGTFLGDRAGQVTRFYLPGRLNYSELTTAHRWTMKALVGALRLKRERTENEQALVDSYGQDIDRVDLTLLDPVVQWAQRA
ncbi:flavodoxin domain-containing protein [Corynebacterium lehmanniae]|uniref:Flavodoxin domain-containing protein n=1 Tax=Corynebacterium lehmanniae TaxID=2913497 RepID=A0ABT4RAE9_9CORY|nr:flavodoxin domain-containing protein [Corynebacterium lehmanniae]MCZ9292493.1 flavodoxin domain-containing protein [Corynebacterium lehmanniae]